MQNIIIKSLNRYLDCDPENAQQLASIENKKISIHLREFEKSVMFHVDHLRLQACQTDAVPADVTIDVSLKVLPDFFLGVDQTQLMKSGGIEINGDAHIASVLQNTFRAIEIDWEEILSNYVGDTVAHQVGVGVRKITEIFAEKKATVQLDVRDYLQDNLQVVPTREEIDEFINEVDKVRAHLDRLEARVNRLKP
jgi:ubiquinone biosynthesis protein UbiJ